MEITIRISIEHNYVFEVEFGWNQNFSYFWYVLPSGENYGFSPYLYFKYVIFINAEICEKMITIKYTNIL